MAVNQGGGGGRAGSPAGDEFGIPMGAELTWPPNPAQWAALNEMLRTLHRHAIGDINTLRLLGRTTKGKGLVEQIRIGDNLTLEDGILSADPSASIIPTLVNQFWYGWQATFDSAATGTVLGIGTHAPASDLSTGALSNAWVHTFGIPYLQLAKSAAVTAAYSHGYIPTTTVNGGHTRDTGITVDFFIATGTPTGGAGHKYWIGLWPQRTRGTLSSDTAPTNNFAAFRYSTAASDTTWQGVTRDGANTTVTDLGVAVTTDTAYHLRIRMTSSAVFFSINGGTETQVTATLPTGTQELWPQFHVWKDTTAAGQLVDMYFNRVVFRVSTPGSLS